MNILIVEDEKNIDKFLEILYQNSKINLIFVSQDAMTSSDKVTRIDICSDEVDELVDFVVANEIDYTFTFSQTAQINELVDVLNSRNLKVFGSDYVTTKNLLSRNFIKRNIYKNKLNTPKFGIFDKENLTLDYLRNVSFPTFIMVDEKDEKDNIICVKSYKEASDKVNQFFDEQHRKVIVEDKIDGHFYSIYCMSDGYTIIPVFDCSYYNNLTIIPDYKVSSDLRNCLFKDYCEKFLEFMKNQKFNIMGFFRFDFILDEQNIYLKNISNNFLEADFQAFVHSLKTNIFDLLIACIDGFLEDYQTQIEFDDYIYVTKNSKEEIIDEDIDLIKIKNGNLLLSKAKTLKNALDKLNEDIVNFEKIR